MAASACSAAWDDDHRRAAANGTPRDDRVVKLSAALVGIGVPAPVEYALGTPVNPPLMPGWDGYPIADRLRETFAVPILVDKDVNTMAWGEHSHHWRDTPHILF